MDEERRDATARQILDTLNEMNAHVMALRGLVTALLVKDALSPSPLREEDVLELVRPLLPDDLYAGHGQRSATYGAIADMLSISADVASRRRPSRPIR